MCRSKSFRGEEFACLVRVFAKALWPIEFFMMFFCACAPNPSDILMPIGDIRPPSIIDARQKSPEAFEIVFNEEVKPIQKSFSFNPATTAVSPNSSGDTLTVSLSPAVQAGGECLLSGEAQDAAGNTTRFLFSFVGYNDDPATLRLNEIQTGKNTASSNLHRDYMEFIVEKGGNLGGIQVQWANTIKIMSSTFPPSEAAKGSIVVLHCAPEGIPAEKDEMGSDLSLSGGIDSSPGGRDFWTSSGGIPDGTGIILLRLREGDPPVDGIFFGSADKTGAIDSEKLVGLLEEMRNEGIWPSSLPPQWEEGFLWKSTASRPLHRKYGNNVGAEQWYVGESGSQSPGIQAPGLAAVGAKSSKKAKSQRR